MALRLLLLAHGGRLCDGDHLPIGSCFVSLRHGFLVPVARRSGRAYDYSAIKRARGEHFAVLSVSVPTRMGAVRHAANVS